MTFAMFGTPLEQIDPPHLLTSSINLSWCCNEWCCTKCASCAHCISCQRLPFLLPPTPRPPPPSLTTNHTRHHVIPPLNKQLCPGTVQANILIETSDFISSSNSVPTPSSKEVPNIALDPRFWHLAISNKKLSYLKPPLSK